MTDEMPPDLTPRPGLIHMSETQAYALAAHQGVIGHLQAEAQRLQAELRYNSSQTTDAMTQLRAWALREFGVDLDGMSIQIDLASRLITLPPTVTTTPQPQIATVAAGEASASASTSTSAPSISSSASTTASEKSTAD